jgi:outer membrane protein OmpA-like peptidoglycan-associated protein
MTTSRLNDLRKKGRVDTMEVKLKISPVIQKIPRCFRGFLLILLSVLYSALLGCASSSVSRSAADEVDTAYENSHSMIKHAGDNNPEDAFQNATQTSKGALIGGTAGAVAGGVMSGSAGILPGAAGGAIIGSVLGAYIDFHTNVRDQLENRGVNVLVLGDQVMIILPSAQVFNGMTPDIHAPAYSTLDLVAQLINNSTTMLVRVGAYTNDVGNKEVNKVVSQQQANAIVKYLWTRLHTRVLSGYGYGGENLIERNNLSWAEGANYRVEITLERLPV